MNTVFLFSIFQKLIFTYTLLANNIMCVIVLTFIYLSHITTAAGGDN